MMYMRATHRDEEGKKVTEKVAVPETRHPDTARHFERKLDQQGLHRMERHPANGSRGIGAPPPKSGRGGKFTWEGPDSIVDSQLDPLPAAIDRNDPNYEEEEGDHEREADVVGEVEVAKVAGDARDGVARVDVVAPPQLQEKLQLQPQ
uniref:Hyaluronan/mRNA-binding protein domain-containing protein n=2 Tax=Oryza TaxID=4527 RepID=A0A0D3HRF6_9ORYZ